MKKILSISLLCAVIYSVAFALSALGDPATITEFAPGTAWTNPSNMTADDANNASCTALNPRRVQATDFGFALTASDVVDSITVRFDMGGNDAGAYTANLYLMKAGTAVGTNNGGWMNWNTGVATQSFSGGLWGTTWLYSDLNASNFGVEFDIVTDDVYEHIVDYVAVTAYYHTVSGVQRSATGGVGYSGGGGFIY